MFHRINEEKIGADILKLEQYEGQSMQGQPAIAWNRACGAIVYDQDENRYIDFTSGVLVANVGHSHREVVAAIVKQVNNGLLTSYLFPNTPRAALVERLVQRAPFRSGKALLFSTGSEAIECCLKLAVEHGSRKGRSIVVSFDQSFHGRTLGSQLAGGIPQLKHWTRPIVTRHKFIQVPYPDADQVSFPQFLDAISYKGASPKEIAAVIIESYQGGTVKMPSSQFMQQLRTFCSENSIILIADEVQAGFGRTGRFWGFEHFGIVPDILACGKGLSASLPLSAVIGEDYLIDQFSPGSLSTTHSGNPICCAAAIASLDVIEGEGLCERAAQLEKVVRTAITDGLDPLKFVVRGCGLVFGIECRSVSTGRRDGQIALEIVKSAVRNGLMLFSPVGPDAATIKLAPPLMISEAELREGCDILLSAILECRIGET